MIILGMSYPSMRINLNYLGNIIQVLTIWTELQRRWGFENKSNLFGLHVLLKTLCDLSFEIPCRKLFEFIINGHIMK